MRRLRAHMEDDLTERVQGHLLQTVAANHAARRVARHALASWRRHTLGQDGLMCAYVHTCVHRRRIEQRGAFRLWRYLLALLASHLILRHRRWRGSQSRGQQSSMARQSCRHKIAGRWPLRSFVRR